MIEHSNRPDTYAVWSKNQDTRYNSTSGGAFTEFAKEIINVGGYVAGAQYDENCMVEHTMVSDVEGIEKLRQSKYVQSRLGDIYIQVKSKLLEKRIVGFCGSPCQVAGLYTFLGKNYDNLITMEFICRGMNSPKAYKAWLKEEEQKENSKAKRVWFKYKDGGWKTSPKRTRIDFEDGHYKVYEGEKNLFMHGYLASNLYIKPCCGNCRFKSVPRFGDITFADFWGIEKELDDDKGTSMLLINSDKGKVLFEKVKGSLECHQRGFDEIFDGNLMFTISTTVSEKAHDFLVDLDKMSFTDALKKYDGYPVSLPLKVVRKVRQCVKRILVR